MIVFKPFLGEILVGEIKECTQDYIRGKALKIRSVSRIIPEILTTLVSIKFFEHIYIPASFLPDPSALYV